MLLRYYHIKGLQFIFFFFENSQPTCITYIWNHYLKINGSLHALRPRRNHAVKLGPYYDSLRVKSSLLDCVLKIFFYNVIDLSKWCYNLHITMWKIIFMKTTFFIWKKNQLKMYYTVFVLITSERPNKFSISQKSQFWIHFIDIVPHSYISKSLLSRTISISRRNVYWFHLAV